MYSSNHEWIDKNRCFKRCIFRIWIEVLCSGNDVLCHNEIIGFGPHLQAVHDYEAHIIVILSSNWPSRPASQDWLMMVRSGILIAYLQSAWVVRPCFPILIVQQDLNISIIFCSWTFILHYSPCLPWEGASRIFLQPALHL